MPEGVSESLSRTRRASRRSPTPSAGSAPRPSIRKGDHWVDSTLKPDDEAKANVIRQFSDEFFELARTQKSELNQYLTFEEPVTVDLDGKVYRFEQASRSDS